jgi:hypothetical protein
MRDEASISELLDRAAIVEAIVGLANALENGRSVTATRVGRGVAKERQFLV